MLDIRRSQAIGDAMRAVAGRCSRMHRAPGDTAPILAALSGDDSTHVMQVASRIAQQHGARTACLRVVEYARTDHSSAMTCEIEYGDPASCIARRARELGASLIVMGIGRHRPLDRVFGADTALRTIQDAPCAVLAVARGFDALANDVVVGTDFSDASLEAARDALAVSAQDATLHFVHVWTPTPDADDDLASEEREYRESLPARFRAFLARLEPAVPARTTFTVREAGHVTECLLDEAATRDASMVAVGRRGQSPLANLIIGSVATRVLRASTRSVLVAPPVRVMDVSATAPPSPLPRAAAPAASR